MLLTYICSCSRYNRFLMVNLHYTHIEYFREYRELVGKPEKNDFRGKKEKKHVLGFKKRCQRPTRNGWKPDEWCKEDSKISISISVEKSWINWCIYKYNQCPLRHAESTYHLRGWPTKTCPPTRSPLGKSPEKGAHPPVLRCEDQRPLPGFSTMGPCIKSGSTLSKCTHMQTTCIYIYTCKCKYIYVCVCLHI